VDYIVRSEGEETICTLFSYLSGNIPIHPLSGVAYRLSGIPKSTRPAQIIKSLDEYSIGWELIDQNDYRYGGGCKAVIMQLSRGCPHMCTYYGQRRFWTEWRHRDPVKFATEKR
jgi:anaerobic magnesium-protoporphyrin IX monomethyl ester cyclase